MSLSPDGEFRHLKGTYISLVHLGVQAEGTRTPCIPVVWPIFEDDQTTSFTFDYQFAANGSCKRRKPEFTMNKTLPEADIKETGNSALGDGQLDT